MSAQTVDDYIAKFSGVTHERLLQMRATIARVAPNAIESISYGMPAYKVAGKPVVYFAGYDKHIGFYATPNGHKQFAADFAHYKQGKGSVQFPHDKPLPLELVTRVVQFRLKNLH